MEGSSCSPSAIGSPVPLKPIAVSKERTSVKHPSPAASDQQRNKTLQGLRVVLAAAVVISHLYDGLFEMHSRFMGWVTVNMFFAMSGWLAYDSLQRSWRLKREEFVKHHPDVSPRYSEDDDEADLGHALTKPHVSRRQRLTLGAAHTVEYQLRRVPPFVWIMSLLVVCMSWVPALEPRVSLPEDVFKFRHNPATNFWTLNLRSVDTNERVFWGNPPLWYISCFSLFSLLSPFFYYIIQGIKIIPIKNRLFKMCFYTSLPFILIVADYFYVRGRLDQSFRDVPPPHPDIPTFALQVSPEGYFNKFFIPMLASGLWSDVAAELRQTTSPGSARAMLQGLWRRLPIVDCIIACQICLYWCTPMVDRHIFWSCTYMSMYLPGNCLFSWAVTEGAGSSFVASRFLSSRWLCSVAPSFVTLFIYVLHVPVTEAINGRPRIYHGAVLGLCCLFFVSNFASQVHGKVIVKYNRLISKVFQKRSE
eukprot:Gregarina_sp_Pseudo_9__482@NODE_1308_length_1698_cov_32_902351_g1229_i0_p1_GENE_NODE_1308_length_1698_cov_32_902351_g1229_i0NODE_1308_length_1698_cov_32_902351_g1229_i0_p1_ORF_typecomplete_len476_score65_59Acyl_transf_3/PF01757_22/2_7e14_NODE_1308_length_1698_cov_32_902351_g1229_i01831610